MERYDNSLILLTGVSSGIGKFTALKMLKEILDLEFATAKPILLGVSRRLMNETPEFQPFVQQNIFKSYSLDLREFSNYEAVFKQIVTDFPSKKISVLINCAGNLRGMAALNLFKENSNLDACEKFDSLASVIEAYRQMTDVNFLATSLFCRLAVDRMDHKFNGYIININSMGSVRIPDKPVCHFECCTKMAVAGITESMRQELATYGSRIRVGEINPGLIDTELYDTMPEENQNFHKKWNVLKNYALKAEDICNIILFMLKSNEYCQIGTVNLRSVYQAN